MGKRKGRQPSKARVYLADALQNITTQHDQDREKIARVDKAIDEAMARKSLVRVPVPKDGACLFRAVAEAIYGSQCHHLRARKECVDYLVANKDAYAEFFCDDVPFEKYVEDMRKPFCWGGHIELQAMSLMYRVDMLIFKDEQLEELHVSNGFDRSIMLCFCHGNHYDFVVTKKEFDALEFCQGLVYKLLNASLGIKPHRAEQTGGGYRNIWCEEWEKSERARIQQDRQLASKLNGSAPSHEAKQGDWSVAGGKRGRHSKHQKGGGAEGGAFDDEVSRAVQESLREQEKRVHTEQMLAAMEDEGAKDIFFPSLPGDAARHPPAPVQGGGGGGEDDSSAPAAAPAAAASPWSRTQDLRKNLRRPPKCARLPSDGTPLLLGHHDLEWEAFELQVGACRARIADSNASFVPLRAAAFEDLSGARPTLSAEERQARAFRPLPGAVAVSCPRALEAIRAMEQAEQRARELAEDAARRKAAEAAETAKREEEAKAKEAEERAKTSAHAVEAAAHLQGVVGAPAHFHPAMYSQYYPADYAPYGYGMPVPYFFGYPAHQQQYYGGPGEEQPR